jgi:hypothetical protein
MFVPSNVVVMGSVGTGRPLTVAVVCTSTVSPYPAAVGIAVDDSDGVTCVISTLTVSVEPTYGDDRSGMYRIETLDAFTGSEIGRYVIVN